MAKARKLTIGEYSVRVKKDAFFYQEERYHYATKIIIPILRILTRKYSKNGQARKCLEYLAGFKGFQDFHKTALLQHAGQFCITLEKKLKEVERAFSANDAKGVDPRFSFEDLKSYFSHVKDDVKYGADLN